MTVDPMTSVRNFPLLSVESVDIPEKQQQNKTKQNKQTNKQKTTATKENVFLTAV